MSHCVVDIQSNIVQIDHAETRLPVSLRYPRFEFDGETVGGGIPTRISGDLSCGERLVAEYAPMTLASGGQLEATLSLQQTAEDGLLRKWANYRLNGGPAVLLKEVVLEEIDTTSGAVTLGDWQPVFTEPMSYPIFFRGFFAGIEFPTASTRIADGHAILAHMPGIWLQPGQDYETKKVIFGTAPVGRERRVFQEYIFLNSPGGIRRFFVLDTWVSIPTVYNEAHNLDLIQRIHKSLWEQYGVALDAYVMNAGWSDPKDLYKVDPVRFPVGLERIKDAVQAMGSCLALWVSPSACYYWAVDPDAMMEQGYEYRREPKWACLAGKHYQAKLKERLVELYTRYGLAYSYFDGFMQQCPETDHGHEPGPLSAEVIAEGLIDVVAGIRNVNPNAWLEATCLGSNAGPWWLFHFNTVLGNYGDDYCWGRVPAPINHESYITCRDYSNLQGVTHGLLPAPLQDVFGGFLCHTQNPVVNDMVMGVMRGNMLYLIGTDPKVLSDYALTAFARIIQWSRSNTELFAGTQALLQPSWADGRCPVFTRSIPAPREAYGYAHWQGDRGIVALRNPWIVPQNYAVKLDETSDFARDAVDLSAVSLYPENRLYATGLKYGDTLTVPLAPYETVILSLEPGTPAVSLPKGTSEVGTYVRATDISSTVTRIEWPAEDTLIGPDWIKPVGGVNASLQMQLDAVVTLDAPSGEFLVLIEDAVMTTDPICRVSVDNKETEWSLANPIQAYVATDIQAPEHWAFVRVPLSTGEHQIHVDLLTRNASPAVSVWAWATKEGVLDGSTYPNSLPQPEIISLDSVQILAPVSINDPAVPVKCAERTVETVDGVYLDCLEPAEGSGIVAKNATPKGNTPLQTHGWCYLRGLNVEAPNRLIFALDGEFTRFQAAVGLEQSVVTCDRAGAKAVLAFQVFVDGEERWASGDRTYWDDPLAVDVDVTEAKTLELLVSDHSLAVEAAPWVNWANARLIR